ncbi:hypothetical protein AcV7_000514 [Taiwanofungus camphoratus]|nr:hypothetical protein AcW2_001015 [Antrodia cinnamomea]KAI0961407.1 hypothetical protein AcV7_000514 [Antrodia cinnamomea]
MVDLSNLRSNTPRPSSKASQRASSVPASSSRRPDWLESLSAASLKRKRATTRRKSDHTAQSTSSAQVHHPSQSSHSRPIANPRAPRTPKSKSQVSTAKEKALSSTVKAPRKRARTTSPAPSSSGTASPEADNDFAPEEGADADLHNTGLLTPAPSFHSRSKTPARTMENALCSRASAPAPAKKNKGKGKAAEPAEDEDRPLASGASASGSERPSKRCRLSVTRNSLVEGSLPVPSTQPQPDVEVDDEPGSDSSFHLLDVPDMVSLPWASADPTLPLRPNASTSLYVPLGVGQLLQSMKHALGQESKARRLAEHRYADEMRRRVDAEKTAAALSEQNRMLERETRAWATAAAETLVSSLESPQTAETGVPAIPSEEQAPIIPSVKLFTVPAVRHAASSSAISRSLPGNLKGKGRMLSWSPDVSPPDGSQTNVLQRAAAVQAFFKQLLPLPARDAVQQEI